MSHDISPMALELLFSPGFFLIKEDAQLQTSMPESSETAEMVAVSADVVRSVPQLIFILNEQHDPQTPEGQMLEKMAGYINNQLGISGTLYIGGPELWTQQQGSHHWVFFGSHAATANLQEFSSELNPQGRVLRLPETSLLAQDPLLKKKAVEAFGRWSKL
ncbi:MAG: hypothetical protein RLZZ370_1744 [Bacteroidota bacterium]|jgi:hypothetical protein